MNLDLLLTLGVILGAGVYIVRRFTRKDAGCGCGCNGCSAPPAAFQASAAVSPGQTEAGPGSCCANKK